MVRDREVVGALPAGVRGADPLDRGVGVGGGVVVGAAIANVADGRDGGHLDVRRAGVEVDLWALTRRHERPSDDSHAAGLPVEAHQPAPTRPDPASATSTR